MLLNLPKKLLLFVLTVAFAMPCTALELSPRTWNHLPVGTSLAGVAYAYTEADIFIDPALLLEDVEMEMHTWAGKYIYTFQLFDKSARIGITQAYQEGEWTGLLDGVAASAERSGWSDSFVRLAVNLYGAPALSGKEFSDYRKNMDVETIVGAGFVVRLPTGEYMDDKLINLGKNRYTFRPQLGVVHTRGKWTAEVTSEVAFFTDNDEFYNGNKLEQDPLYILTGHLTHTFRPGLWTGLSLGYDYGGETTVNGIDKDDASQNIGWALSFAYPINRYSGVKFSYVGTRTQEDTGMDSNTLMAALAYSW